MAVQDPSFCNQLLLELGKLLLARKFVVVEQGGPVVSILKLSIPSIKMLQPKFLSQVAIVLGRLGTRITKLSAVPLLVESVDCCHASHWRYTALDDGAKV